MAMAAIFLPIMATILCAAKMAGAADPDPLQDFCVADLSHGKSPTMNGFPCVPESQLTADDFVFTKMRSQANTSNPFNASAIFAFVTDFPALNTLGISCARLDYEPGGVIRPHIHGRGTEIFHVIKGTFYAGFVTSKGRLYAKIIESGDVMVFPRALNHFQINIGTSLATAFVALSSQDPGFQSLPPAFFSSGLPDEVIQKSLFMSDSTIARVKALYAPK